MSNPQPDDIEEQVNAYEQKIRQSLLHGNVIQFMEKNEKVLVSTIAF